MTSLRLDTQYLDHHLGIVGGPGWGTLVAHISSEAQSEHEPSLRPFQLQSAGGSVFTQTSLQTPSGWRAIHTCVLCSISGDPWNWKALEYLSRDWPHLPDLR